MVYLTPSFAALLACVAPLARAGVLPQAHGQQVAFQHAPVQSAAARAVGLAFDSAANGHRWSSGAFASAFRHSRTKRRSKHPKDSVDDDTDSDTDTDTKHHKPPKKVTAPLPDSFVHKGKGKPKHVPGSHHDGDDSEDSDDSKHATQQRPKHHGSKDKRGHSHIFYDVPIRVHGHGRHGTIIVDGPILVGGHGHYLHRAWKRFSSQHLDQGLWGRKALSKRRHTDMIIEKISGHHHPHVSEVTVVEGIRTRANRQGESSETAQGVLGLQRKILGRRRRPDIIITRPETIIYEGGHGHSHGHSHSHSHRSDLNKRDESVPLGPVPADEVPGSIDIISHVYNSPIGKKIASLVLSTQQSTDNSFDLNASNTTVTQIYLKAIANAPPLADGFSVTVKLLVPVFSPVRAALVFFCATFDPNPPAPAPLTAKPCTSDVTAHESQLFAYNPETGVIRPLWMVNATDLPDAPPAGNFDTKGLDSAEVDPSPSVSSAASPAGSSVPDAPLSAPQNVTMVFTPATHAILQNAPPPPNNSTTSQLPQSSVGAKGNSESMSSNTPKSLATSSPTSAAFGSSSTPSPASSSISSSAPGAPAMTMTVANLVVMPSVTPVVPEPYEWMFTPGQAPQDPQAESD